MAITIAVYDKKIFDQLSAMSWSGIQLLHLQSEKEECSADILLLEDTAVRRASQHCNSTSRPSFFVLAEEGKDLPSSYVEGLADDLLLLPIRRLDILRLVRLHHQMQSLRELENTSKAIPSLVEKLKEDLLLAQKVQRLLIKEKFPPIAGLNVKSKYWCGMQSGGDYFDIFEFPDHNHVGILFTDCSSYSLSTNFLGALLQIPMNSSVKDPANPSKVVEAIYEKIRGDMKETDEFSILYAVLDKKTYQLRMVSCGKIFALHQRSDGSANWIANGTTESLKKTAIKLTVRDHFLEPMDRVIFLSDGWKEQFSRPLQGAVEDLSRAHADAHDLVHELAFSIHKNADPEDTDSPMPSQDCSILIMEVAKNILRLATEPVYSADGRD